jgi:putative transposase
LTEDDLQSVDSLNKKFNEWLEVDYHRKKHLGLDRKPLDVFMEQIDKVKMCTDPEIIETAFRVRVKRTVHNAGTISLNKNIYEVPGEYIGAQVEVRYTPENLDAVYIYLDDLLIHTASKVDFEANAKAKRTSFSNFSEN